MEKQMSNLFKIGKFTANSQEDLDWKIECDALTNEDWNCIVKMIMELEPRRFKEVFGIATGGNLLAEKLNKYSSGHPDDKTLIVDDVVTTGASFDATVERLGVDNVICWAVFDRRTKDTEPTKLAMINSLFRLNTGFMIK